MLPVSVVVQKCLQLEKWLQLAGLNPEAAFVIAPSLVIVICGTLIEPVSKGWD